VQRCVVRRLVRRCSSSCAASFDFASCCGVRLFLLKDQLQSINYIFNQWFGRQRCRSGSMGILVI